jgi:hypothetical protein
MSNKAFTIVVLVNDEEVLQKNLLLSPLLLDGGRNQLILKRDCTSASIAFNSAIEEARNDLILFVHQDIYLPETWFADVNRCLALLKEQSANWGVLGCFGSHKAAFGGLGRVYTRGLGRHGRRIARPEPVQTLDEIVLIVRRSSGLLFDPLLPHFHLYGTDICLAAEEKGLVNYAFQGFCVHNTMQLLTLPPEFYACYRYIRSKWAHRLPIYTSCLKISFLNGDLYRRKILHVGQRMLGLKRLAATRVEDPRSLSSEHDRRAEGAGRWRT